MIVGRYLMICAALCPVMLCLAGILMYPKREGIVIFLAGLVDLTGYVIAILGVNEQRCAEG
jgi:hypothetical protein